MKQNYSSTVINRKALRTKCALFLMTLLFTVSLSSCVEEATLDSTNYEPISVVTQAATSITATSATINAECSASHDRTFKRGICAAKTQNPTTANNDYSEEGIFGSYSVYFYNLQSSTTYYARAYVINGKGQITYGNQISFNTLSSAGLPILTTTSISSITSTSAVSGGSISSTGGYNITARGVCWGTYSSPTIIHDSFSSNGTGSGTFTSYLTGLTAGTTYYVRAYATNSLGTSYGGQVSFTATGTTATVSDYDGNIYHTVNIGSQVWMVENLKTTHYNDGTTIPLVTDTTSWKTRTTPAYCWFDNDATTYKAPYGALYNWYTVNTGKLAPIGWHVPTDAEWTTLTDYLGATAAKSLAATTLWNTSTITGAVGNDLSKNNSTGFTAFPSGFRSINPTLYYSIGYDAVWWSSTQYNTNNAWYRELFYLDTYMLAPYIDKQAGFSVRCIKD